MRIGLTYPRNFPPSLLPDVARQLEDGGVDDVWVVEDCFFTTGPSLAAATLAATETIQVGIGIFPAVIRHPALTAMEIATLANLGADRFIPGIGHGVQRWMEQLGLKPKSPLTALEETFAVVRRLLAGEEVTFAGKTTSLDSVRLDQPPADPPPLLAGVFGPRSIELAGRIADGLILAGEPTSPSYVDWARSKAGVDQSFTIVAFAPWLVIDDRQAAREILADWLAGVIEAEETAIKTLPFFEDLKDRAANGGSPALASAPNDWWNQIAPVGSPADANAYLDNLETIGVDRVSVFPAPMVEHLQGDVASLISVASHR